MSNAGKTVRVHYTGTMNDGSKFDSSYDRNEPLQFVCGTGMMIKGFDEAVMNMEIGQTVDVHLMPEEAYGQPLPEYIFTFDVEQVPGAEELNVGDSVYLTGENGQPLPARVTFKEDGKITFDLNHVLAGEELNFRIELLEIVEEDEVKS